MRVLFVSCVTLLICIVSLLVLNALAVSKSVRKLDRFTNAHMYETSLEDNCHTKSIQDVDEDARVVEMVDLSEVHTYEILEIHSNGSGHPMSLPKSCTLGGLVIRNRGYLIIESRTQLSVGFIHVESGGTLHVRGEMIDILLTRPTRGIKVGEYGTMLCRGNRRDITWMDAPGEYVAGSHTIPINCTSLENNDRIVITTSTDTYRDNCKNPIGGTPTWFDFRDDAFRCVNTQEMSKWIEMTDGFGVEVSTVESLSQDDIYLKRPLYFNHKRCHVGVLTRSIRIHSKCGYHETEWVTYPGSKRDQPRNVTNGHWAFGTKGTNGAHIKVQNRGHLLMDSVELYRMGSSKGDTMHVMKGGTATVKYCSIWKSFARFITVCGNVVFHNNVCFWSMGSGVHVETNSKSRIERNMITSVHNSMPHTFWNNSPFIISPRSPLDFYMTSAIWIDEPTTKCKSNVLCCSPSPVIGIWSDIRWVEDETSVCGDEEPDCTSLVPLESYHDNICYNMEGFWSGLPDGKLQVSIHTPHYEMYLPKGYITRNYNLNVSGLRESRWMEGGDHVFNLGPMDWTGISIVKNPCKTTFESKRFFVLCSSTNRQLTVCQQKTQELNNKLCELMIQWENDRNTSDTIRMDLESEVEMLIECVSNFKCKITHLETMLNAKMLTGQIKDQVGIGRGMFFKDVSETKCL